MSDSNYFVHSSSFVDQPTEIGNGTKIWHFSHIMANAKIGQNCNIGQNVVIATEVIIGNNVKIQNNVSVYTGVCCEDDVFIGPSVVFTNVINPRSEIIRRNEYQKTYLEKGVTIGANATIVCGIVLGKYSFVGAGSVVTKNTKPYSLVVGNPAKQTGWISEAGYKLIFNEFGNAKCPDTNQKYILHNNQVSKSKP